MQSITQIITMKCMGHCNYCMYGSKLNLKPDVDLDDLLDYYRQIKDMLIVKITGGEPLQPNTVDRTLKFIRGIKEICLEDYLYDPSMPPPPIPPGPYSPVPPSGRLMHYQLNTNGAWGVPQEIIDDELAHIQISCDGPKWYMEQNYGHPYWEQFFKTLESVKGRMNTWLMMVITDETEQFIPYVRDLAFKFRIEFRSQWAAPVDKGANFGKTQKYIEYEKMCHKYGLFDKFTDENGEEKEYPSIHIRALIPYCPKDPCRQLEEYEEIKARGEEWPPERLWELRYCITAEGKIVNCPILSQFETGLDIYNTKPTEGYKIIKALEEKVGDRTCIFPEGFCNYWNNTTEEEKETIKKIMVPYEKECLTEKYGLID